MKPKSVDNAPRRGGDPLFMTSLARGLCVLRALLEGGAGGKSTADLSRATGLHRAVVRRCLYTLGELGYVSREGSSYCLGPQIATLDRLPAAVMPVAHAARPVLDGLSRRLGEPSALAVLDDGKVIYLACAMPDGSTSAPLTQGAHALGTAAGRILLASLPQHRSALELSRVEHISLRRLPVSARSAPEDVVCRARREGYALVEEERSNGARTLAVPVRNVLGMTLAAMEVDVRTVRLSREGLIEQYLPLLKTAAVTLGRGLQLPHAESSLRRARVAGAAQGPGC